ncbi:Fic family protein [soil metagenome]
MPKTSAADLPDVFLTSGDQAAAIYRARQRGDIRKIGPRLYTRLVTIPASEVIKQRRWQITALYAPGAVIGYRTAFESQPTAEGTIFANGAARKAVDLDGLHLRILAGPGPLEGDTPFIAGLTLASRSRALLESLKPSRARHGGRPGERHSVPHAAIERYLDSLLETSGEDALASVRDLARRIAPALNAARELAIIEQIVSTLLGSRPGQVSAPYLAARTAAPPYDAARIERLEALRVALSGPLPHRVDTAPSGMALVNAAFLDAYFSNYIEGTEFEIGEARGIVFDGRIIPARPQDSHDVLETYRLLSDPTFLSQGLHGFSDAESFIAHLRGAHRRIMSGRPDQEPGVFKTKPNRAGNSQFVDPALVSGTLREGFTIARSLTSPYGRALALMFIVSEVHPFNDGNGRVSRALMNAELVAGGLSRIIVPTVYREDYLGGLRALTREGHVTPYLETMNFAQRVTSWVDYHSLDSAIAMFAQCHAFDDDRSGARLRLPAGVTPPL